MVTKRMVLTASLVMLLTSVVFGEDAFFNSRGVKLHYIIQAQFGEGNLPAPTELAFCEG
jgi:hypothetical protein